VKLLFDPQIVANCAEVIDFPATGRKRPREAVMIQIDVVALGIATESGTLCRNAL